MIGSCVYVWLYQAWFYSACETIGFQDIRLHQHSRVGFTPRCLKWTQPEKQREQAEEKMRMWRRILYVSSVLHRRMGRCVYLQCRYNRSPQKPSQELILSFPVQFYCGCMRNVSVCRPYCNFTLHLPCLSPKNIVLQQLIIVSRLLGQPAARAELGGQSPVQSPPQLHQ